MVTPKTTFLNLPDLQWRCVSRRKFDWVGLWEKLSVRGPAVLLESAGPVGDGARWLILAGCPQREYFGLNGKTYLWDGTGSSPSALDIWGFLDQVGRSEDPFLPLPFCLSRAWFGVLSYELGTGIYLERKPISRSKNEGTPSFYFFKPSVVVAHDRQLNETHFFGEEVIEAPEHVLSAENVFKIHSVLSRMDFAKYEKMVLKTKSYIRDGDIYQANLSQGFEAKWEGNEGSLYRLLREMNPGPFMGIFKGKDFTVVSSSPERLIAGQGDRLEARPIAGTRPRGTDSIGDLQLRWELRDNPKEQAEHLMLVDLARNDIGRVSEFGSVEVKRYADIESYATVHHLVSMVQGRRRYSAKVSDVMKSMFPAGTITGCPKIRSIEIIDELENSERGFYTGSMGYLGPGPCFDFNILIRSITLKPSGILEFCSGAGIVADSDPKREYMETLYKVEALARTLGTSLISNS